MSDGTPARTRRLADIAPGPASSNPSAEVASSQTDPLVAVGGRLYFSATDGSGRELWATPLFLFDDGFESTDTTAWSLAVP